MTHELCKGAVRVGQAADRSPQGSLEAYTAALRIVLGDVERLSSRESSSQLVSTAADCLRRALHEVTGEEPRGSHFLLEHPPGALIGNCDREGCESVPRVRHVVDVPGVGRPWWVVLCWGHASEVAKLRRVPIRFVG